MGAVSSTLPCCGAACDSSPVIPVQQNLVEKQEKIREPAEIKLNDTYNRSHTATTDGLGTSSGVDCLKMLIQVSQEAPAAELSQLAARLLLDTANLDHTAPFAVTFCDQRGAVLYQNSGSGALHGQCTAPRESVASPSQHFIRDTLLKNQPDIFAELMRQVLAGQAWSMTLKTQLPGPTSGPIAHDHRGCQHAASKGVPAPMPASTSMAGSCGPMHADPNWQQVTVIPHIDPVSAEVTLIVIQQPAPAQGSMQHITDPNQAGLLSGAAAATFGTPLLSRTAGTAGHENKPQSHGAEAGPAAQPAECPAMAHGARDPGHSSRPGGR